MERGGGVLWQGKRKGVMWCRELEGAGGGWWCFLVCLWGKFCMEWFFFFLSFFVFKIINALNFYGTHGFFV
ncbi:hypothetical protein MMJ63_19950 [Bacillus vallismortis]|nr:hypothetical protein [Bacillus vallismortis]